MTPVKQIGAGVLDVGYVDAGPADGCTAVLLHGWPYGMHTFDEVSPLLASAGFRVIVPYLRGYGTTRFVSQEKFCNGQQSVLAVDTVALMDALGIETAVVAGADWGARTAGVVAALWPQRCAGLVAVSGYLIGSQQAGGLPLAPLLARGASGRPSPFADLDEDLRLDLVRAQRFPRGALRRISRPEVIDPQRWRTRADRTSKRGGGDALVRNVRAEDPLDPGTVFGARKQRDMATASGPSADPDSDAAELDGQTEGEGFEPSDDVAAVNGFQDRRIQPLCHPSSDRTQASRSMLRGEP